MPTESLSSIVSVARFEDIAQVAQSPAEQQQAPVTQPAALSPRIGASADAQLRQMIRGGERMTRENSGRIFDLVKRADTERRVEGAQVLPVVGGAAGSLVGGVPGAAIGGAVGEAGRQAILRDTHAQGAPEGAWNQLKSIGASGAVQGLWDAAGRYVLEPVAKAVYGAAMRPSAALRKKYGTVDLVKAGYANRVLPVENGFGVEKAGNAVKASQNAQLGMADAWDAANPQGLSTMAAVRRGTAPQVQAAHEAERAVGASSAARDRVVEQGKRAIKLNPPRMPARRMKELQHSADDIADPAYVKAAQPGGPPIEIGSPAAIAKGSSRGYRETLNEAVGPEYAQQGRTTKTLFGVKRMAQEAADRPNQLSNIVAGAVATPDLLTDPKSAVKRALLFKGLLSPTIQAAGAVSAVPFALYGGRAADAGTGGDVSGYLRDALLRQLTESNK